MTKTSDGRAERLAATLTITALTITALTLAALTLASAGCTGAGSQGDVSLLGLFTASVEDAVPKNLGLESRGGGDPVHPDRPTSVSIADSRRAALLTWVGVEWSADMRIGRDAAFEVTLAALGASDGSPQAQARLEIVDTRSRASLLDLDLPVDGRWTRHRLRVPETSSGRIRLSSSDPEVMVAWAEIHLLGPADPESPRRSVAQPDVVLILVDTLRADHLSTYGYERATSPNLDRFAESASVFEQSFSASTWTLPSTASLLTGLLPAQHGLRTYRDALSGSVVTVAELLQQAGYRTVALTDGGFLDPRWGFDQGFERYDVTPGAAWEPKDVAKLAATAMEWIEENEFHPYFLMIHTYETHNPYLNAEGFADPFFDGRPAVNRSHLSEEMTQVLRERRGGREDADPHRENNEALYDGEIARVDHYLGKVIGVLEEKGDLANAAVLVTSDHGEELMDHGNMEHGLGKVFDPNVRVPLLLKTPGRNAGARIAAPSSGLDVFPTLLELATVPIPPGLEGRSLLSLVEASAEESARSLLIEGLNSFPHLNENRYRIDQGSFTLVHDLVRGRTRWYDRTRDPAMVEPSEDLSDQRSVRAVGHLQATLAWLSHAKLAVRLPAGFDSVTAAAGSRLEPRGAWVGLRWRPAPEDGDGALTLELEAELESYLLFDLRHGAGDRTLKVRRPGSAASEQIWIRTRTDGAGPLIWSSKSESPPPFQVAFPTFRSYDSDETEMTPEAAQELRALGYLD